MIWKEMLDKLYEVDNTISLQNNKSNLHSSINDLKVRCISYLGLILSNLLFTTDLNQTINEDKIVNFVRIFTDLIISVYQM